MDKTPLSDSWRKRPSQVQAIDLADVLNSLKKVIGAATTRQVTVNFASHAGHQSEFDGSKMSIIIDPKFALKSTPVLGADFDVLAGEAAHEAWHSECRSDEVVPRDVRIIWDRYQKPGIKQAPPALDFILAQIKLVGEEVYIDNYGKRNLPILGEYLFRSRQAHSNSEELIDWSDLYNSWVAIAVYGHPPTEVTFNVNSVRPQQLQVLMEVSALLMKGNMDPNERWQLYSEAAQKIFDLDKRQRIQDNLSPPPPLDLESKQMGSSKVSKSEEEEPEDNAEDETKGEEGSKDKESEGEGSSGGQEDSSEQQPNGQSSDLPNNSEPVEKEDGDTDSEGDDIGKESGEPNEGETGSTKELDGVDNGRTGTPNNGEPIGGGVGVDGEHEETPSNNNNPSIIVQGPSTLQAESIHPEIKEFLPPELVKAIEEVIDSDIQDLVAQLKEEFGEQFDTENQPVIWCKATTDPDRDFNQTLANQLRWFKEFKNTIGHQTYRNQQRGRVDKNRIHNAPTTGNIFKVRRELVKGDLDLVLLLDCSSSMAGDNESLYEDAKALFKTIPEAKVLSYFEWRGEGVTITDHTSTKVFRKVTVRGGTPSGIALAATAMKYPNSMIIHFTDGESNHGEPPEVVIPQIAKNQPKVKIVNVHLEQGNGMIFKGSIIPEFPNSKSIIMKSILDFPKVLKEVLMTWR